MEFGEVLFDEHLVNPKQPYLFNGKELDYETGLYYYGARYYDPKVSLWLNTDPLSGYNPILETEHYIDGQHNGGVFNFGNLNTYTYTYQNPILYVDPNGKQNLYYEYLNQQLTSRVNTVKQNIVNKFNNVKQKVRNAYNSTKQTVIKTAKNTQKWVKNNKQPLLNIAKGIEYTGDGAVVVGYGLTVTGIGAEVGVPLALGGNALSVVGGGMEIAINFIAGDKEEGVKNVLITVGGEVVNKGLDKLIPGLTPDIISEKSVEILKQGNVLKTKIIEKSVEHGIEKNNEKR